MPATLESTLAEEGFDVVDAREQLAQFLAVQNTYLSTFQSLGALGLLLGTIGLAVVQLRSVLERRGELALMRAEGFRAGRLMRMVIWENAVLLVGGLAVGGVAAADCTDSAMGCRRGPACRGLRWGCCWVRLRSSGCWPVGWRRGRRFVRRLWRRCGATSWQSGVLATVGVTSGAVACAG